MEAVISQKNNTWRVIDVLKSSTDYLEEHNIENPRLNAEWLLSKILGVSRINLYVCFDQPLTKKERDQYKELIYRRVQREPLQYIVGHTEFMSLPFYVNSDVLIPRPETEVLVETIIKLYKDMTVKILDIGVGSGAISVSLAHYIKGSEVVCLDVSAKALKIAEQNAKHNGVLSRLSFKCINILNEGFQSKSFFDVVVSNPPYVSLKEWDGLEPEIKEHEPKQALIAGEDGLDFYPVIAQRSKFILKKGGLLAVEVGFDQSKDVTKIFNSAGYNSVRVIDDYNKIPRVVAGTY